VIVRQCTSRTWRVLSSSAPTHGKARATVGAERHLLSIHSRREEAARELRGARQVSRVGDHQALATHRHVAAQRVRRQAPRAQARLRDLVAARPRLPRVGRSIDFIVSFSCRCTFLEHLACTYGPSKQVAKERAALTILNKLFGTARPSEDCRWLRLVENRRRSL